MKKKQPKTTPYFCECSGTPRVLPTTLVRAMSNPQRRLEALNNEQLKSVTNFLWDEMMKHLGMPVNTMFAVVPDNCKVAAAHSRAMTVRLARMNERAKGVPK